MTETSGRRQAHAVRAADGCISIYLPATGELLDPAWGALALANVASGQRLDISTRCPDLVRSVVEALVGAGERPDIMLGRGSGIAPDIGGVIWKGGRIIVGRIC